MPRFVRNWWVEAKADGSSPVATGPRSLSGGISVQISQRDQGSVKRALRIEGNVTHGKLVLSVYGPDGDQIAQVITDP